VADGGDGPVLDGRKLELPILFEAIGDPEALDRALGRVGGMVSYLKATYPSARITLVRREQVVLPPTARQWGLRFAEDLP
jgi:uncharacterized protein YlxW (UPF0749 family)